MCYYRREKRFNARMLTALTNRLGDVAILLVVALWIRRALFNYGLRRMRDMEELSLLIMMVVMAAITKSAQIPFSA